MSLPRLYTYFRSGAAQRVRIGLALKGVAYESISVHLVRNGGEHLLPAFKESVELDFIMRATEAHRAALFDLVQKAGIPVEC